MASKFREINWILPYELWQQIVRVKEKAAQESSRFKEMGEMEFCFYLMELGLPVFEYQHTKPSLIQVPRLVQQ